MMQIRNVKFNRNLSRAIFFAGVFLSFLIPLFFYLSLNRAIVSVPKFNSTNENIIYAVDKCEYKKGELKVSGWATDIKGYSSVLVSANLDGKDVYLRTSVNDRPDVSKYFNKKDIYDRSGFSSSLNIGNDIKNIIISIQISKNDKTYVVKYDCK